MLKHEDIINILTNTIVRNHGGQEARVRLLKSNGTPIQLEI